LTEKLIAAFDLRKPLKSTQDAYVHFENAK